MAVERIPESFDRADTVETIANDLIRQFHPSLAHIPIAYLFKNKEMRKGEKLICATCKKCSAKEKALASYKDPDGDAFEFVIVVSYPTWGNLTDTQKRAVIDHELNHCFVTEDGQGNLKTKLLQHDLEEFKDVIRRHGMYFEDVRSFIAATEDSEDTSGTDIQVED